MNNDPETVDLGADFHDAIEKAQIPLGLEDGRSLQIVRGNGHLMVCRQPKKRPFKINDLISTEQGRDGGQAILKAVERDVLNVTFRILGSYYDVDGEGDTLGPQPLDEDPTPTEPIGE